MVQQLVVCSFTLYAGSNGSIRLLPINCVPIFCAFTSEADCVPIFCAFTSEAEVRRWDVLLYTDVISFLLY